jgi:hypothetical protein
MLKAADKIVNPNFKITMRTDTSVAFSYKPKYKSGASIFITKGSEPQKITVFDSKLKSLGKIIDLKDLKTVSDGLYQIIGSSDDSEIKIEIQGLEPSTKYLFQIIDIQSKSSKEETHSEFSTLAKEPRKQARILNFYNITKNSMTVGMRQGDGSRRILVVSEKPINIFPKDAHEYKPNNVFGKGECLDPSQLMQPQNAVFTAFFDNPKKNITQISGLKPGEKYYFMVCEANGEGDLINFMTTKDTLKNYFVKSTLPEPPVALDAYDVKKDSFMARWRPVGCAWTYILDVAFDAEFKKLVADYTEVDVGVLEEILIEELPPSENGYFYRLRVVCEGGDSDYSNVIHVKY